MALLYSYGLLGITPVTGGEDGDGGAWIIIPLPLLGNWLVTNGGGSNCNGAGGSNGDSGEIVFEPGCNIPLNIILLCSSSIDVRG